MFCPKCGSEIDNDSLFCPKCGVGISGNQPNKNGNTTDVTEKIEDIKTKLKTMPAMLKNNRLLALVLGLGTLCIILIIIALSVYLKRDPIIGKWIEDYTWINGVSSEDDPTYLQDRDPYEFSFYKDGSFRASGGYGWENTTTGTWKNVTTEADERPQYILTADGDSAKFFKGTRNSLSWLVNGYGHDVIVFKKK